MTLDIGKTCRRRRRAAGVSRPVIALVACGMLLSAATLRADEATDASVESGREALTSAAPDPPWYDASSDGIGRLHVKAKAEPKEFDFNPRVSAPGSAISPLVVLAWVAFAAIVIALAALLVRAFVKSENDKAVAAKPREAEAARVEELPIRVPRGSTDLLGEARRQYEAGNYSEAIIYLFSYQLLQLDRHQWIRLARGKTNRQYLADVSGSDALRGLLELTMVTFETVYFGNHNLDRLGFEACWSRLDEFEALVEQVKA